MKILVDIVLLFGGIFTIVLFAMYLFMKLARGRVEASPERKHVADSYMASAPVEQPDPDG